MSSGNKDTVLTIVDKSTRLVHLVPCRKNVIAVAMDRLRGTQLSSYMGFLELYIQIGVPRSRQISGRNCDDGQGTGLGCSTAYHPQTEGWLKK